MVWCSGNLVGHIDKSWAWAVHPYCSAQVDSAFQPLWDGVIITTAMVDVDGSCQFLADSQLKSTVLV